MRHAHLNDATTKPLYGQTGGQHPVAGLIDHQETYAPHVIEHFVSTLNNLCTAVDVGAGFGRDLEIVKRIHPAARTIAVEAGREYAARLIGKVDEVHILNIERDSLPFASESLDLVIANQVLEHTKEVFWIFHEMSRILKVGGHLLIGVPNIASLHNRFLLLFGKQPTQHKLCSAHVRPFSKNDTLKFLQACFPQGYYLAGFKGSQFYPFPPKVARLLAYLLPTAAVSILFLLRKERSYRDEFASYPARACLETNFWRGSFLTDSQYY